MALEAAFADARVDSVLTCFIPPLVTLDEEVAAAVAEAAAGSDKPCVATFLGMRGVTEALSGKDLDAHGVRRAVPAYSMPEDAVRALAAATRYGEWRARDQGERVAPAGIDRLAAERAGRRGDRRVAGRPAPGRRGGGAAAGSLRHPGLAHRRGGQRRRGGRGGRRAGLPRRAQVDLAAGPAPAGASGVRVDLASETSVREAFAALSGRLAPLAANSFVVQRMADAGRPVRGPHHRGPAVRTGGVASASPGRRPSCSATSATGSRR